MTWYYVPSGSLASVPAQEVSTSECMTLWADALAQSYTRNTKSLPAKSWLRVLRTVPWMTRRFGATFTPSMLADGAARWMGSLGDTPASRFPLLGSGSESMTRGTSGRQSRESSLSASQVGASSKMWLDTFGSDTGTLFAQTSNALATGSRKASSRRRKSAPPTSAKGSSSWPTARAQQAGSLNQSPSGGPPQDLGVTARNWPTPVANDDNKTPEGHLAKKPGRTVVTSLNIVATKMWPTPDAPGQGGPRNRQESRGQGHNVSLGETAEHWATPRGSDQAGASSVRVEAGTGQLREQVERFPHSPRDPETGTHGSESSQSAPTLRRQLNPRFTEWLMGWPPGWTSLAPLGSDSRATASYPPRPATPSAPSGDNWGAMTDWPTPRTTDQDGTYSHANAMRTRRSDLRIASQRWEADNWPTPDTQKRAERVDEGCGKGQARDVTSPRR